LEKNYEPIISNIDEYEKKQEEEAIISIDELIKKKSTIKEEKTDNALNDEFLKKLKRVQKNLYRNNK